MIELDERRRRILIVDDDPSDLEVIAEALEREGYEIVKALSGKTALEIINSEDFDLVVTDLKLPDLDGMEILRRAKEEIPYVEVIVLTGYGTVEGAVEAMQSGAFTFLQKPVDINILRQKFFQRLDTVYGRNNIIAPFFKIMLDNTPRYGFIIYGKYVQDFIPLMNPDKSFKNWSAASLSCLYLISALFNSPLRPIFSRS